MGVFEDFSARGCLYQVTDPGLGKSLDKGRMVFYAGFDPTANSLHVGNLLVIMGMVRLQAAGHKPIGVCGGGTGLIGDPSGKSKERPLLLREDMEKNLAGIRGQLEKFLDFSAGPSQAVMVNNLDWLGTLNLIDFLREVGKHFRVNEMIAKESVKQRLLGEEGMSFTEFCYQLLQAYDFYHLCREFNCRLQVGGSDQWGNITAGIDLIRRLLQKDAYGLTFPLVTSSTGAKFGKSEQGTVWLDAKRTSPYQFYQYWIQADDRDVVKYLKYFSRASLEEIAALEELVKTAPEKREAQRKLALEMTALLHGKTAALEAEKASQSLFSARLEHLTDQELLAAFQQAPSYSVTRAELEAGIGIIDLLLAAKAFASRGEAKRKISEGGVYLNNQKLDDQNYALTPKDLASEHFLVLRTGKKKYFLVKAG